MFDGSRQLGLNPIIYPSRLSHDCPAETGRKWGIEDKKWMDASDAICETECTPMREIEQTVADLPKKSSATIRNSLIWMFWVGLFGGVGLCFLGMPVVVLFFVLTWTIHWESPYSLVIWSILLGLPGLILGGWCGARVAYRVLIPTVLLVDVDDRNVGKQ